MITCVVDVVLIFSVNDEVVVVVIVVALCATAIAVVVLVIIIVGDLAVIVVDVVVSVGLVVVVMFAIANFIPNYSNIQTIANFATFYAKRASTTALHSPSIVHRQSMHSMTRRNSTTTLDTYSD